MTITMQQLVSMLVATVLGALIGLERELSKKPVGLRTNILICLGACIFTIVSIELGMSLGGAPERMAANVVQGIGFLGAGAIIRDRGTVQGATTAATIWLVASLGVACGAGYFVVAIVGTVLTLFVLFGLHPLETRLDRRHTGGPRRPPGTDERGEDSVL